MGLNYIREMVLKIFTLLSNIYLIHMELTHSFPEHQIYVLLIEKFDDDIELYHLSISCEELSHTHGQYSVLYAPVLPLNWVPIRRPLYMLLLITLSTAYLGAFPLNHFLAIVGPHSGVETASSHHSNSSWVGQVGLGRELLEEMMQSTRVFIMAPASRYLEWQMCHSTW